MDFLSRIRELSGINEAPVDSIPIQAELTPPLQTPPPPATSSVEAPGRLDQLIVVMDPLPGSTETTVDDILTIVTPSELVNLVKGCATDCNYAFYPLTARAEAEADANSRLADAEFVARHEEDQFGKADFEGGDEWINPSVKESTEVQSGFIPDHIKNEKPVAEPSLPKETLSKIKSLVKEIDDCMTACEVQYKHCFSSGNIDDAANCLKSMEVCHNLKCMLSDGKISQAATYYTSLMGPLQDKIPVTVRKFLQHGGRELPPLKNLMKDVSKGDNK